MKANTNTLIETTPDGLSIMLLHDMTAIAREWQTLQDEGNATAYQQYDWIEVAYKVFETKNKPVIIYAKRQDEPAFIIPLVLEQGFPSVLRWPGANHANIGSGLFSTSYLANHDPNLFKKLFKIIGQKLPGSVVLWLKNQPEMIGEKPNPLLDLPNQAGPNPLFKMDITVGMDTILEQGNAKRKRKLFRKQCRVAEKLGGYELTIPKTTDEIERALNLFFDLKEQRLGELGVKNVFEPDEADAFLRALSHRPNINGSQPLRFFLLEVGGIIRALYGCSVVGNRCFAFINAVKYDDFAEESPGEMVLYMMLEHLIDSGFEYFDIGIGRERYKYSWCKNPVTLLETVHAISPLAVPYVKGARFITDTKHRIKSNPYLWNKVKEIRKLKARLLS